MLSLWLTPGRSIAYVTTDQVGRYNVWVRPFPQGQGRWQVSQNGGTQPQWSRDGDELFFVEQGTLVAVPVSTDEGFTWGRAEPLFSHEFFGAMNNPRQTYEVSADGERFLILEVATESLRPALRIVQNWYEEFRDRRPD